MKGGFRRTLEGIVIGTAAIATLLAAAGCNPKPATPAPPKPPTLTQPYSVNGTMASLGYGKDGKLVVFDADAMGDRLFSYATKSSTFLARKILTFGDYSVIINNDEYSGVANYVAFFNKNSELVGTAQNSGKLESLIIINDYKDKNGKDWGDLAVMAWETGYGIAPETEEGVAMAAINKSLGVDSSKDGTIFIGPGFQPSVYSSPERASNGVMFRAYSLNSSVKEIAARLLMLARDAEVTGITYDNGRFDVNASYKDYTVNKQDRSTSGTFSLDNLLGSGIAPASPLLPAPKQK